MTKTLFIFGYGYTGQVFGALMRAKGWQVYGTSRETRKTDDADVFQWPGDDISAALQQASHILVSAAPDENGDPVLARMRQELAKMAPHLHWVGYLSTTGVYGDHGGGWVDEDTKLAPATTRGHHRELAENQWLELYKNHGLPLHIFRLAGIYGPGRGPFSKVRNGTARRIIKKNQVFSRIHVDDIAQTLLASLNAPDAGNVYNVCDNDPAPPQDVIAYAAKLLGKPVPSPEDFLTADLSPMARSFYGESKKVSNTKIINDLGVKLKYPDFKSGLEALLAAELAAGKLITSP